MSLIYGAAISTRMRLDKSKHGLNLLFIAYKTGKKWCERLTLAIVPLLKKSALISTLSKFTFFSTTRRFFCFDVSCLTFFSVMSLLAITPS